MKIPFSTFSAYVVGTPAVKLASAASIKQGYEVKNDYWKRLREAIPKNHQTGNAKSGLDKFLKTVDPDSNKATNFAARVADYKSWWGTNALIWWGGNSQTWSAGPLDVGVSPELFLTINSVPHVIRIYFNKDKIPNDRANVMLRLMELAYHHGASQPVVGVLDLGRRKLISPKASLQYLDPLLIGEAASFVSVYNSLP